MWHMSKKEAHTSWAVGFTPPKRHGEARPKHKPFKSVLYEKTKNGQRIISIMNVVTYTVVKTAPAFIFNLRPVVLAPCCPRDLYEYSPLSGHQQFPYPQDIPL